MSKQGGMIVTERMSEVLGRAQIRTYPGSNMAGTMVGPLVDEVKELRRAVAGDRWADVWQRGFRLSGLGYGAFRVLRREASTAATRTTLEQANSSLRSLFTALTQDEVRTEFVARSRAALAEKNPELLAKVQPLLDQLEQGDTDLPLFRLRSTPAVQGTGMTRTPQEIALIAITWGLLGLVHAEFNRAYRALSGHEDERLSTAIERSLDALVTTFGADLRSAGLVLYSLLARDATLQEVSATAMDLAGRIEDQLPLLARAQARAFLYAQSLRAQGKGSASERIGKLGTTAGLLTREAVAAHTAAYQLMLELPQADPAKEVAQLRTRASSQPFEVTLPNGRDVDIAKLMDVEDGTLVEVEGFVQAITVGTDTDNKLTSWVELVDPSSGTSIVAAARFINFIHVGLTGGASCRLNGVYRTSSDLFEGQAGLEVDRLALAELAKNSWWLSFLRSARRWYEVWRNGQNLCWVLGPHQGEAGPDSDLQGAAELIYLPLIRS